VGVDLVLDNELLSLAAANVRLGLVVSDDELDHAAVDAARLVDPVHGHLGANERCLAARGGCARQRLERANLVGVRLPERLTPRCRDQQGGAERPGRRCPKPEEAPPRGLAAPPHILRPWFVLPTLGHGCPPLGEMLRSNEKIILYNLTS